MMRGLYARGVAAFALVGMLQAVFVARQAAPVASGHGTLAGTVTTADGRPAVVRRATVTLAGGGMASPLLALTDDDGRFAFRELPAGRYTLSASKPAYVTTYFGSRRPGRGPGVAIALADGESIDDLRVALPRGAVIAGTVRDASGWPNRGAIVTILEPRSPLAPLRVVAIATANDIGEYRAFGLPPGRYLVAVQAGFGLNGARTFTPRDLDAAWAEIKARRAGMTVHPASPPDEHRFGYAPVFFGGSANPSQARSVAVLAGDEREQVDIDLQLVPTAALAGRILDPRGGPPANLQMSMMWPGAEWGLRERSYIGTSPGTATLTVRDGRFVRSALVPGRYVFFARASSSDAPEAPRDLWAAETLDVSGTDVHDYVIRLQPGMAVSGRATFGGRASPGPMQLHLKARSRQPHLAVASVQAAADGSFVFQGVPPGEYSIDATALRRASDWALMSAMAGGVEVLDEGFTVRAGRDVHDLRLTFTDHPSAITGRLVDRLGRPAPEFVVVVFSAERKYWTPDSRRVRSLRPASDGRYSTRGLPPGEYLVGAVTDLDPVDLEDASFLELLAASSTRVTLEPASRLTLDLQITSAR
jgi:hypothetical protein